MTEKKSKSGAGRPRARTTSAGHSPQAIEHFQLSDKTVQTMQATPHHPTDAPVAPFEAWYGFPAGETRCDSVQAFSPSTLVLREYEMVHPGGDVT